MELHKCRWVSFLHINMKYNWWKHPLWSDHQVSPGRDRATGAEQEHRSYLSHPMLQRADLSHTSSLLGHPFCWKTCLSELNFKGVAPASQKEGFTIPTPLPAHHCAAQVFLAAWEAPDRDQVPEININRGIICTIITAFGTGLAV